MWCSSRLAARALTSSKTLKREARNTDYGCRNCHNRSNLRGNQAAVQASGRAGSAIGGDPGGAADLRARHDVLRLLGLLPDPVQIRHLYVPASANVARLRVSG